jgi:hypothetical protein
MTTAYIVIILLQAGIIIHFARKGRKQQVAANKTSAGSSYSDQRNLALSITPYQLKLAIPDDKTMVYGVVMDWNMGATTMTLVAYITGAANMYLSTGGGVSNGGADPNVGEAAVEFVVATQEYLDRAIPTNTTDIPAQGCVRFYLLTNKGVYAIQEHVKHFDDNSSILLGLFQKGNDVVTAMRAVSINN